MLKFNFQDDDLGLVFPLYYVQDFLRKMFLMLYCINWRNYLYFSGIMGKMHILIICFPESLKLTLPFLSSVFLHDQKSRKNLKNEKSF